MNSFLQRERVNIKQCPLDRSVIAVMVQGICENQDLFANAFY